MFTHFFEQHSPSDAQASLFTACRTLDLSRLSTALEKGANPNKLSSYQHGDKLIFLQDENDNRNCYSPLSLVAMAPLQSLEDSEKSLQMAAKLLASGAKLSQHDVGDMGNTPWHWAIVARNIPLIKLFVEHAKVSEPHSLNVSNHPSKPYYGSNPPIILAMKVFSDNLEYKTYHLEEVMWMIEAGADVNITDHKNNSILHWAAVLRVPAEFIELLFSKNIKDQVNQFGHTALDLYQRTITKEELDIRKQNGELNDWGFFIKEFGYFYRDVSPQIKVLNFRNSQYDPKIVERLTTILSSGLESWQKQSI